MAEITPTPPAAVPASTGHGTNIKKDAKHIDKIRLHSFSDVIFFWPTCLISAIFAIIMLIPPIAGNGSLVRIFSWIWLMVFIYNVFIVAFDFPSGKIFGIVAALVAVIMLLIILQLVLQLEVLSYVFIFLEVPIDFYWAFYLFMAALFGIVFGIMLLEHHISYVEIKSNQVYIKHGILGEKNTQSTKGMQVYKEIDDVFEYFILKSGDITLHFPHGTHTVLNLPNIMNINQKVKDIHYILSKTEVDIH